MTPEQDYLVLSTLAALVDFAHHHLIRAHPDTANDDFDATKLRSARSDLIRLTRSIKPLDLAERLTNSLKRT